VSLPPALPVIPRYADDALNRLVPELLAATSGSTVLLVLDGLGWEQLVGRWHLAPTMSTLNGGSITTVAPSTTATALTSLTTGLEPAEHGLIGYRMVVDGEVLNALRWATGARPDARQIAPPEVVQPYDPFLGRSVSLVTKAEFRTSGFSQAHLRGSRFTGYRTIGTLLAETVRVVREGESFVYAYYDGIDKVAHEYGLADEYDSELMLCDWMVAQFLDRLPTGTRLIITADHGQVDCRDGQIEVAADVLALTAGLSGEGRFRWLHAGRSGVDELLAAAVEHHAHHAWVRSLEQVADEGWFGRTLPAGVRRRLGDVALVPFEPISFADPDDTGPYVLIGRHGSLTGAEMFVPRLAGTA
jgi:hypothetical protein